MKPKKTAHKQQRHERTGLLLIGLALLAMLGFGAVYSVEFTPDEPITAPEPSNARINQLCQQKLLDHIKQGGIDLHAQMSYGDLQGCNFSSESEQLAQRRSAAKGTWTSVIK